MSFTMHTTSVSLWLDSTTFQCVELGLNFCSQKVPTPQHATLNPSKVEDTFDPQKLNLKSTKAIIEKRMAFEVNSRFEERHFKQKS